LEGLFETVSPWLISDTASERGTRNDGLFGFLYQSTTYPAVVDGE
jgi:hypothetical protein